MTFFVSWKLRHADVGLIPTGRAAVRGAVALRGVLDDDEVVRSASSRIASISHPTPA